MATPTQMAILVGVLGVASFISGLYAEIKKLPAGEPIEGKEVVICKYPSEKTVVLGYTSIAFLVLATAVGYYSLFLPYYGKSIPQAAAFRSGYFTSYFNLALGTTGLGATLLLWATMTEHLHIVRNIHHDLKTACPTAKTGVLGGGAFVSFSASLFWLVSLMLVTNVREDFFDEDHQNKHGITSEA